MDSAILASFRATERLMIQDVAFKFCRAADRLDKDGMLACFHADAWDDHGAYNGPAQGLVDWILERNAAIPMSSHFVGNIIVEFIDESTALVESYVRTIQQYPPQAKEQLARLTGGPSGAPGKAVDIISSSRFLDRFECRDSSWKIAHRTVIQEWKQLFTFEENGLKPRDGWAIGRRDGKDPMQLARKAFGLV